MFKLSIHSESAIKKMYKEAFRKEFKNDATNVIILESSNPDSFLELSKSLTKHEIDYILSTYSVTISFEKPQVKDVLESVLKKFELENKHKLYYFSALFTKELQ